jgi:hypothetical protein
MAKSKDVGLTVSVDPNKVMYTNISTSKDGYNSASVVIKAAEKEYMRISYEWEGKGIPGFAMDLMAFMKQNSMETAKVQDEYAEEYAAYVERHKD